MNCLRCNTPNDDGAKFCKNCGVDLNFIPSYHNKSASSADPLLIVFLAVVIFANIGQVAIQKIFNDWYNGPGRYVQVGLWILQNLSYLLIPLAIKDKNLKIAAVIVTGMLIIYWLISNIQFLIGTGL